jgi:G:T/U-mismatch repair DNA glycosylase
MTYLNEENVAKSNGDVEFHPLIPFLPSNAKVLFLGSFPPQRKRWSMDFYYPNFLNDHWRIEGLIFFKDKNYFVDEKNKSFYLDKIVDFLTSKGIAFFDTAYAVRRLQDNASDKFLEVVQPTDIHALLRKLPECKIIVTTGEKATMTLCETLKVEKAPKVGEHVAIPDSKLSIYRLPSSSRAYPLSLDKKAEHYRRMFDFSGIL